MAALRAWKEEPSFHRNSTPQGVGYTQLSHGTPARKMPRLAAIAVGWRDGGDFRLMINVRGRTLPFGFPLLQQLFAILAQVETAAHCGVRHVAHDALPEEVIEGHGVEAI